MPGQKTPSLTRGPLPAGVYWRRRIFVLGLAVSVVFVIASWLGGGSDGRDEPASQARQAGAVTASQTVTIDAANEGRKGRKKSRDRKVQRPGPTYDPRVLVEPDGNCEAADVRIDPVVGRSVAGRAVEIGLSLQTVQTDACYFRVGPDKVSVLITKKGKEIWTSRECPDQVPQRSVVVRRVVATQITMTWDARASTPDCTRRAWAMDGNYTVIAAVLGGEPADSDFELVSPVPETITIAPEPTRTPKREPRR